MIPQKFCERMRAMLKEAEFAAFMAALEAPPQRALRVNTDKIDSKALLPLLPFAVTPLPFAANAFYAPEDKVGATPTHHAGLYYMQDPSAISTVAAVHVPVGARVLELCAAPGGKSTQLAAAIGPDGVLLSNEYIPARCRILQGNVERMGLTNTIVTNLAVNAVAAHYPAFFDLVVVDAPCSGEGMLRKYEVAGQEWSEENVKLSAARQQDILREAAKCVAPGGRLLYSTCTFSLAENEENVAAFLEAHPDFSLVPVESAVAAVTADGIAVNGRDMTLCRRFYPHLSPGEGQFIAVMVRENSEKPRKSPADAGVPLTPAENALVLAFFKENLTQIPQGRLVKLRDTVYLAPKLPLPPRGLFAPGVAVGAIAKNRIEPHHHLFSAYGRLFLRQVPLTADDPRTAAYLRGEEIPCTEQENTPNGYAAVLFAGAPLGGGKMVGGRLKNHYPKGLRNKS